jgi:protein-S-isoprenylcysteine O-methyltransferase Ste14
MAIFGIFCFGIILGPVSFFMAISDLREMARGRMDPSGKGLTIAGQIVGLIVAILSVIGMFVIFSGGLQNLPR